MGYYLSQSEIEATNRALGELFNVILREFEQIECKYCHSKNIVHFGHYKGIQRYFCNSCRRKFVDNDALPKMKTSVPIIANALNSFYGGMSLDNIVENIKQQNGITMTDAGIHNWIIRFTKEALEKTRKFKAKIGDDWICDETVLPIKDERDKLWLINVIDRDTRFLLASELSINRSITDIKKTLEIAKSKANKNPRFILSDGWKGYVDAIEQVFGADVKHIVSQPFAEGKALSTNVIERWHGTLKDRTKPMRSLGNPDNAQLLIDGFVFYYNYFRPHESLDNKTPAEVAGIKSPYRNWDDVIRMSVPKEQSHEDESLKPRYYEFEQDERNFRNPKSKRKTKHNRVQSGHVSIEIRTMRK